METLLKIVLSLVLIFGHAVLKPRIIKVMRRFNNGENGWEKTVPWRE